MKAKFVFENIEFKRASSDANIKQQLFGLRPGTLLAQKGTYPRVFMLIKDNGSSNGITTQIGLFARSKWKNGKFFAFHHFSNKEFKTINSTLQFLIKVKPNDLDKIIERSESMKRTYRDYDIFRDIEKETGIKPILDKEYYK